MVQKRFNNANAIMNLNYGEQMILSDLIVNYLEQFGVEYVFSVPGTPLSSLYDALARSEKKGGVRVIFARHENGAALLVKPVR